MFLAYSTIKKILLIAAILTVGFFISQNIANAAYVKQTKNLGELEKQAMAQIQEKINQSQDFKKLFQSGRRLVEKDPRLAGIFLEKATELEPNYRDARLLLGYAQLTMCHSERSEESRDPSPRIRGIQDDKNCLAQAKESLTAALKLDPIYGKTHYLLSKIYAFEGDAVRSQESLKKAGEMGYNSK